MRIAGFFLALTQIFGLQCSPARGADLIVSDNPVPIPATEQSLAAVQAAKFFSVGNQGHILEGPLFDDGGNLLFCNVTSGKVMRLSPDKKIETVVELEDMSPGGIAIHKDGRLFVAALNLGKGNGAIYAFSPASGKLETILSPEAGYLPNDLVFDAKGGFYFSDFRGTSTCPSGGVYYVSPDLAKIVPVIPNMAQANGVALSPDGKILWATEYARNLLHRVNLADAVTITPTGSKIPYQFVGPAPDSMRVDKEGNVYVAMVGQGRALIFNKNGFPVAQVLLPDRENGLNLRSTSLAVHPHKKELYIVSGNTPEAGSAEAAIFSAPSLAEGQSNKPLK